MVMAVDLTGGSAVVKEEVVETDDEFVVGFEVEYEAFATLLEDETGKYFLSYGIVG